MDAVLRQWIQGSTTKELSSCNFCSSIGVVYAGVKPAEILCVSAQRLNRCILLRESLGFVVLRKCDGRYWLFVYHPERLEATLRQHSLRSHLKKLGYDEEFTLEGYLSTLMFRLRHEAQFPHEIGFFLGYPMKDVLGFMGRIDLPLGKIQGWRMYGNTCSSEQLYRRVRRVKEEILHVARQTQTKVCSSNYIL